MELYVRNFFRGSLECRARLQGASQSILDVLLASTQTGINRKLKSENRGQDDKR